MLGFARRRRGYGGGQPQPAPGLKPADRGALPSGLIGLRTVLGGNGAQGTTSELRPGWTYHYERREKLLHVPTVPPPIVYSAFHPVFIGPGSGVQGYTNTGPSSYFMGRGSKGQSWPFQFRPYLLPPAYNRQSQLNYQAMTGQPWWSGAVLDQPRPWRIPNILSPRGQ